MNDFFKKIFKENNLIIVIPAIFIILIIIALMIYGLSEHPYSVQTIIMFSNISNI